jgi:hypothetical protein
MPADLSDLQNKPLQKLWRMDAANYVAATHGNWTGSTKNLGWFNTNWLHSGSATSPISAGDNYYKLNLNAGGMGSPPDNSDNLLLSFGPVDPDHPTHPAVNPQTTDYNGCGDEVSCLFLDEDASTDFLIVPNPGYIGFAHAGIPWGTLSLSFPTTPGDIGASDLVYLRNFTDYIVGPVSPYENACDTNADGIYDSGDDDGDGYIDEQPLIDESGESDTGDGINNDGDYFEDLNGNGTYESATDTHIAPEENRFVYEIRQHGKINVNTASEKVLRALCKYAWLNNM